jgi:hypothetical protein
MTTEQVRQVVRDEIFRLIHEPDDSKKKRWIVFLNSGLGLWILSSLLVGGLTFAYSKILARQQAEESRLQRLDRVQTEIELRFHNIVSKIEHLQAWREKQDRLPRQELSPKVIVNRLPENSVISDETRVLFSKPTENQQFQTEFKEYTIRSLFAEAFFLSRGKHAREALSFALEQLDQARRFEDEFLEAHIGAELIGTEAEAKNFGFAKVRDAMPSDIDIKGFP